MVGFSYDKWRRVSPWPTKWWAFWLTDALQVKNAIKFASYTSASSLPDGAKGDMCRAVENDVQFGRLFLTGPNPVMLTKCSAIPKNKFPVTDDMLAGLLDRSKNLQQEARVGNCVIEK